MANDAMFFTQVFSIENGGSYMGLQQDGGGGRKVRFSIWNATAFRVSTVEGAACRPFGGEGVGMTCTIPYAWETGRWYRLRIRMLDTDAEGQWWGAWVMDDAGREQRIGDIRRPGPELIRATYSFNEFYGQAEGLTCGQPPPSSVYIYQPLVDDDSSRATPSHGSVQHCSGGRVTELWSGELARLDLNTARVVGPAPAQPPVAIDLVDGVDLVVHSPRVDYKFVAPRQSFTFSADVRNLGMVPAAPGNLNVYRSNDPTISTTDTLMVSVPTTGLAAAAGTSASLGVKAPTTVGTYYFGACVDSVPDERDADNNCSTGVPVVVTVDDPTTRSALVEIYRATGGATWKNRTNWLSERPIGTWHGVETNAAGRVTHLRLRNNGLTGHIPDALRRLPFLEDLRLDRNYLTGSIPAWLKTLSLLRELWLNSNRLRGRIPAELGALARLGHLSLDRNDGLTGPLPSELGSLTSLWTLRLNHTWLAGPVPLTLVNLRSLNYMDVRNTGLCAPDDPAFQSWLRTVNVNGGINTCADVSNSPPQPVGTLPDVWLREPGATWNVDVSRAFVDQDGDILRYTASSSAPLVASVAASGSRLTLTAVGVGSAQILVTAGDPAGLSATQTISVTVTSSGEGAIVRVGDVVRVWHVSGLRTAVDAVRRGCGLDTRPWTDAAIVAGETPVKAVHLVELRSAVEEATVACAGLAPRWTDAVVVAGETPVKAVHFQELWASVLALEQQ